MRFYKHSQEVNHHPMVIAVTSRRRTEFIDITASVEEAVRSSGLTDGVCMISVPHTTAGITLNENADPTVKEDILKIIDEIVPFTADYHHREGNSAAHIKSTLVGASVLVGVESGRLVLGTWQGIFFCEFDGPRKRTVHIRPL